MASICGCSIPFLVTKDPQKAMGATLKQDPKTGKLTQAGLQAEVMDIADEYVLLFWQALDEIIRAGVPPRDRIRINRAKVVYSSAALTIAAGRNPAANLLDMVAFITIGRMAVEDYWVPKVYGAKGQTLLTAYRKLEKEAWSKAAQVLSPEQQDTLRSLIKQWRAAHPKQYYVSYVRLSELATLRGESPVATENSAHGLLAEVEKALVKADEAFLLAERAMFYVERVPRIVTMQTELIMDEATTNPEVQRLVKDVDKAAESFAALTKTVQNMPKLLSSERKALLKQMGDWADTERQKLWQDLAREEPRLKGIMTDLRETLVAGSELAKAVGALTDQFKADPQAPVSAATAPLDYVKALQQTTETVKQASLFVKSLDDFVVGERVEEADLVKVLRQLNAESKTILNHAFGLALILILFFWGGLVAALLGYRYLARRLVDSPRSGN